MYFKEIRFRGRFIQFLLLAASQPISTTTTCHSLTSWCSMSGCLLYYLVKFDLICASWIFKFKYFSDAWQSVCLRSTVARYPPATRETWVRFPVGAITFICICKIHLSNLYIGSTIEKYCKKVTTGTRFYNVLNFRFEQEPFNKSAESWLKTLKLQTLYIYFIYHLQNSVIFHVTFLSLRCILPRNIANHSKSVRLWDKNSLFMNQYNSC